MYIAAETLDDALRTIYPLLLTSPHRVVSSKGSNRELSGVLLEIQRPRARLSRTETRGKPFSCLGELLWYLSQENSLDFIKYYIPRYEEFSDDGSTVHGGYGPRLFKMRGENQIKNIIRNLTAKPTTRQAVIQIFDSGDLSENHSDIPCTTTFQFLQRNGALNMITTMRSNDAFMGLPHDIFCFTMLQEIVAMSLGKELGSYRHFVGSLHLYETDLDGAEAYVSESVQPRIEMPEMPRSDPWPAIYKLLEAERHVRLGLKVTAAKLGLHAYWEDIVRLLQVFQATGDAERIDSLKSEFQFKRYGAYIDSRKNLKPKQRYTILQPELRLFDEY